MENFVKKIVAVASITSIISYVLATIYYIIFFFHFPDLSPKILTLTDYFDKASDLVPLVLLSSLLVIFLELRNRKKKEFKPSFTSWAGFALITMMFLLSLTSTWAINYPFSGFFLTFICLFLGMLLPRLKLNSYTYNFNLPISSTLTSILCFGLLLATSSYALNDVVSIRDKKDVFIDTISEGILISKNNKLVFTHKSGGIFESKLDTSSQSIRCIFKAKTCKSAPPK